MLNRKQAQSDRLPLTHAALVQAMLRTHFSIIVWNKDDVPNPVLPSLSEYRWAMKDKEWVPVTTDGASACQVQVAQSSDALPIDANAAKLSSSVQICVAVLTMAIARTSKMTITRTKRKRRSAMSKNLSEDAKNCEHV